MRNPVDALVDVGFDLDAEHSGCESKNMGPAMGWLGSEGVDESGSAVVRLWLHTAPMVTLAHRWDTTALRSSSGPDTVPDALRRALDLGVSNPPPASAVHGEAHWKAVALLAILLGADARFAVVFACLHDLMRESDADDPDHGRRAAGLFGRLVRDGLDGFPPATRRTRHMTQALRDHSEGRRSTVLDVGACWDGDRLDLIRLGIVPDLSTLSTPLAKDTTGSEGRTLRALVYLIAQWREDGGTLPLWRDIAKAPGGEADAFLVRLRNRWTRPTVPVFA